MKTGLKSLKQRLKSAPKQKMDVACHVVEKTTFCVSSNEEFVSSCSLPFTAR